MINTNASYEGSFAMRLRYVGLNTFIVGLAMSQLYFAIFRGKAAKGEKYD